ncbi:predicted protein [Histoplasma capsulatum var. duboisii H88]|uniref:Predicted protein n=1 Tax=Ajellomyces capsulatus (strain H88) TaxID=544711 RepID=F0UQL6_AJEC8|nr:predicted protein [Histoplasma capsulatum var. duboisii H88]
MIVRGEGEKRERKLEDRAEVRCDYVTSKPSQTTKAVESIFNIRSRKGSQARNIGSVVYKYWYVYPSTSSKTLRERSALANAFVLVLHGVNKGLPHFPWRRFPVVVSTSRKLARPLVTDGYSGIRTRPSPQRFALYKTAMVRPEGTEPDT